MFNVRLHSPFMHSQSVKNQQMLNQNIPLLSCLHLTSLLKCLPTISRDGDHSHGGWAVRIRTCHSVSQPLFVLSDPREATRRIIKHPMHFTCIPAAFSVLSGSGFFSVGVSSTPSSQQEGCQWFWWEYTVWKKKNNQRKNPNHHTHTHYKSHHLCNQKCETSANEQLVCGWCAVKKASIWFPQQSLLIVPPDQFVWHINIHILRLASFSPDLPLATLYLC